MCGAFPIDRENPGQESYQVPTVNMLKKSNHSLIMFPSGSHIHLMMLGLLVIAKMAKVKIMPVVYQGPRELKGLLTGERVDMNYGNPIDISDLKAFE